MRITSPGRLGRFRSASTSSGSDRGAGRIRVRVRLHAQSFRKGGLPMQLVHHGIHVFLERLSMLGAHRARRGQFDGIRIDRLPALPEPIVQVRTR